MKNLKYIITVLIITASGSFAQGWQWVNPLPQGNPLNAVGFINDNTGIAAGSLGTMIKTTNGGMNWSTVNTNTQRNIWKIFFATLTTVYACGDSGLVLKSTDLGSTWSQVNINTPATLRAVQFFDQNTGITAGSSGQMFKTTNGGANWMSFNSGTSMDIWTIWFTSPDAGYIPGSLGTIQKTNNGGANWTVVNTGRTNFITKLFFANGTGYAACTQGEVLKSTNDGQSWFLVGGATSSTINDIFFTDANNGSLVLDLGRIYRTTNGGVNWEQTLGVPLSGRAITFINGKGFMTAAGGRIFRSTNNGAAWNPVVNNVITNISGLTIAAPQVSYMVAEDRIVYKSTDGGNSWSLFPTPVGMDWTNNIAFADANTGIIVGSNPNMKRTTNGGLNWVTVDAGTTADLYGAQFINANTGYVTGDLGVVCKTTNGGLNWVAISTGTSNSFEVVYFLDESTGFAGGMNQKLFRTVNGGLNWSQITSVTSSVNDIHFVDANTGFTANDFGMVFRTTNGGANWQAQQLGSFAHNAITFVNSTTGYTATDEGVIYKTTNAGANWAPEPRITINAIKRMKTAPGYNIITAGIYGSIMKYGLNVTSTGNNNTEIPKGFSLEQNFPNPFNPATVVKFSIPADANVKLVVFDIAGREVKTLADGKMNAGRHELSFSGAELSSGVYFYRLDVIGKEGISFTDTKKMILVK